MSHAPRILASTGALLLSPLEWTLEAIADAGFDGAELLLSHHATTRTPEKVRTTAERVGIDIPVVHGPYMLFLRNVLSTNYIQKTRRSLALTAEMGAEVMVAHAPFRWERKALAWLEEDVDAVAAEHGVVFGMENMFPVLGRTFSAAVTPEQMSRYTHVVFDTSHFAVAGVDLLQAWDALADRVVHLHVSDNLGTGSDDHAPIGAGVLPLERFLGHVGRSGYSGTVTLELDCRASLESRDGLVSFLAAQRDHVERLLTIDTEGVTR